MKHWVLAFVACGAVTAIAACSSDDDGGGGGNTGGGTGGGVIGGAGGSLITGGNGGSTNGGSGGSTNGGSGGGGPDCNDQFFGQKCANLTTNDAKQTECLHGDCCDELDACLGDAECAAFLGCSSACGASGGTPQTCGAECQPCVTSAGTPTIINNLNSCITTCTGTGTDGGTGGSPGDSGTGGAATDAASGG